MEPYKGLQPYTEEYKDNFFGREAEKRILIDKILTHKLTFLFAASGVGKSSLLQAAVLPELKNPTRLDRSPLDVIYYKDWVDNPLYTLKKYILSDLKAKGQLPPDEILELNDSLKDFFHFCTAFTSDPLVVILDQFEEFFNYQRFSAYFRPVIRELAAAIHDRETETVFVISMREDFALELNAFKDYIPTFLIDNFYRLEKLTLENARLAVVEPVAKIGFQYEPALLEKLLEDLLLREQRERGLTDIIALHKLPPLVEPPHLQMICMQLWDLARDNAEKQITQTVFERKGGTEGLLETYFLDKIQQLSGKEKQLASKAFDFLVNRHGTKMPRSLPDLAKLIRVEESILDETLDKLETGRILRRQLRYGTAAQEGILWYELHHDFFSQSIYQWNEAFKTRKRIQKWGLLSGAVVLVGGIFFVVWDAWVNANTYHLRLSIKSGLSDVVEIYQGEADSYDVFKQQGFVAETVYERSDIEADKLFIERAVVEFDELNTEMVGRLALADRIAAYLANGDLNKALGLARCAISDNDMQLSEKVILNLVSFRSVETFGLLGGILKREENNKARAKIVEVLAQTKAPEHVVPFLITRTKDEINNIRRQVAKSLVHFNDKKAIEALIVLLKDQSSSVQEQAAESLGQLGGEKAIEALNSALHNNQEDDVRRQAKESLAKLSAKQAIEPLMALLNDPDSEVRGQVAKSLGQLGAEKAIESLIVLINEPDFSVPGEVPESLKLDVKQAIEPLIALLNDPDSEVRGQVTESLWVDAEKAIKYLMNNDSDSSMANFWIRKYSVKDSSFVSSEKIIEHLIAFLKKPSLDSHWEKKGLFFLLSELNWKTIDEKAIEALIALLNDHQKPDMRGLAAWLLGQLYAEKALDPLIVLLNDENPNIRKQAAKSLGQLGSKKAIKPLTVLLNDQKINVQKEAILSLGYLSTEKAIEPLISLLNDKDNNIQWFAVESLGQLGIKKAIEPLIALINETSVRRQVPKSLGQLGAKEAIKPLITLLTQLDKNVQKLAIDSLKLLNNTELFTYHPEEGYMYSHFEIENNVKFDKNGRLHSHKNNKVNKLSENISPKNIQELFDLLKEDNIYIQKRVISSLGKMAANAPKESQTQILDKLTAIASNEQELFGIRIKALESLGKLGTEAAANNIIQIAEQAQGEYKDSYLFTAYQALQDTKTPIALHFLQKALDKLTQQKQDWRNQRAQAQGEQVLQSSTTACTGSPQADNEKRWRYGYWETELGYAIAQHDPANAGIEMLKHPLANVREGAWFGIAKIGVPTVEVLQNINRQRERSSQPHFRHAAFRAIDKSLITIEVYGTQEDVQALEVWLPEVSDFAVKDRISFTLAELSYRLEEANESGD